METFERTGFETDMGGKLFATFLTAGLPGPEMMSASRAEGGHRSLIYAYMAATVQSLLSAMERVGVTTADEVGIDDLAERLRDEAVARKACIILPPFIGAWTKKPA